MVLILPTRVISDKALFRVGVSLVGGPIPCAQQGVFRLFLFFREVTFTSSFCLFLLKIGGM